ncbi:MAG: M20/M25/M40 family metallo-hydrolase, partial [Gemmatimonadota bacterium]
LALTALVPANMFRPMHTEKGSEATAHARAARWLAERGPAILSEQIELARTPAPPFRERSRAELIAAKLRTLGLTPRFDGEGNLLARIESPEARAAPEPIIVAAHVDTVFGPDITIEIRQDGARWTGPGITDNARGLAVSLGVLRALLHGEVRSQRPIIFAFTVGEEGPGDLRGVKHMFRAGSPLRHAAGFIAVDGSGRRRIIHRALGSRRFRITVRGPGGHSWNDWGRSNPANAIGELIHRLCFLDLPESPRTTLTAARLGGGISINAIPGEAWVELDLRSEADEALQSTEHRMRGELHASVVAEETRNRDPLTPIVQLIGHRPAGHLPSDHPLVAAAVAATRTLGEEPEFAVSSTDANVPLALGIPAIAIGGGGKSGLTHTSNEWFEDSDGATGALRLLAILAASAGF